MADNAPPSSGSTSGAGQPPSDLIGDLFAIVGLPNPFAGIAVTFEQMRRGSEDFLVAVETFTRTMENMNATTERINRLLDDVETPIRTVAPAMTKLAETISSPAMSRLPSDLDNVVGALGELARRLAPLGQLAESAGGMFGLRSLLGSTAGSRAPEPPPEEPEPPAPKRAPATTTKKAPTKKAPAKKAPTKTTPAKKTAAKKPSSER